MTDDQVFEKWDKWVDAIHKDVQWLLILRHIFWNVQDIIQANPRIQKPSTFYQWMGITYSTAAAIGVRRQLDKDKRSISFVRLFKEIQKKPAILSRSRFVSLYTNPDTKGTFADHDFDRFAGPGGLHVNPDIIGSDFQKLETMTAIVERYATKTIAHFDEKGPDVPPTFKDLDGCLDLLQELVKKYLLLFRTQAYLDILPVWHYEWQEIFREPWLTVDSYQR